MDKLKKNTGITLIALVITVVLLLILAGISIRLVLGENGLVTKSKDASKIYDRASKEEQLILDEATDYINTLEWGSVWSGTKTSNEGVLDLPMDLTDLSCIYEISLESDKYSGPAILHVYSTQKGVYMGRVSVTENEAYGWKLRNIQRDTPGEIDNYTNIYFLDNSDSSYGTLTYNMDELGDLKITNISKSQKQYSRISKFIQKSSRGENITVDDLLPFVNFALRYSDLGYSYVNDNFNMENAVSITYCGETTDKDQGAPKVEFSEDKERNVLNYLATTDEEIEKIEKAIRDEILTTIFGISNSVKEMNPYTISDYIEENKYLSEFFNRYIGNTVIPYTYLYLSGPVLDDLNEDGNIVVESVENAGKNIGGATSITNVYNVNEYAGICSRYYADAYSIVSEYANSNLEAGELALLQEMYEISKSIYRSTVSYWTSIYNVYGNQEINNFFSELYNENYLVNMAGLRIAYYSFILPQITEKWKEMGYNFNDAYNAEKDTKYLNEQLNSKKGNIDKSQGLWINDIQVDSNVYEQLLSSKDFINYMCRGNYEGDYSTNDVNSRVAIDKSIDQNGSFITVDGGIVLDNLLIPVEHSEDYVTCAIRFAQGCVEAINVNIEVDDVTGNEELVAEHIGFFYKGSPTDSVTVLNNGNEVNMISMLIDYFESFDVEVMKNFISMLDTM